MKAGKLRTYWIIILSALYTVNTTGQAALMQLIGRVNRSWVDKTLQIWARRVLQAVRVKVRIVNPYDVAPEPGVPTIIMCNHSSLYDIPLSFCAFPTHPIRMLAKKELSYIPIIKQGMNASEFPFIDRKNRHQAIKTLEKVKELLQKGIVLWIAPEGTRSKTGTLGPFKKGGFITAINAGATIIPIGIRGASTILPARTTQFNLDQTAEVHIGRPIDASQYTLDNKEALVQRVRQEMILLVGETYTSVDSKCDF
jgi:1-acyl-sn-glycerol-3-phosphate acyltransferase